MDLQFGYLSLVFLVFPSFISSRSLYFSEWMKTERLSRLPCYFLNIVGLEGEKSDGEKTNSWDFGVRVVNHIFSFNREITMSWTILFSVWKTTSTPSSPCQMNLSWRQWRPLKLPHRPIAIELFTPLETRRRFFRLDNLCVTPPQGNRTTQYLFSKLGDTTFLTCSVTFQRNCDVWHLVCCSVAKKTKRGECVKLFIPC